ncbi:MAG: acyl-CoA thioesterase [Candidatus Heimdallarchaeota archaeon]|nr:acyl-CoA thioesterase [Candidatus Heimdallarchaeota archaeon]MDH5644455.1 acyl-CoA thioesterase [Candidatus Heimdallarchaeota archaeon]
MDKSPSESETETVQLMMPSHSNPSMRDGSVELGSVNGGAILNLIDNVAGLAALRHCRTRTVTASIDSMSFLNPVKVGELLILKASVNYVGSTSLEVGVRVETENLRSGERKHTGTAYLTFVSVDQEGKPIPAPKLKLETAEQHKRYEAAKIRLENRKRFRNEEKNRLKK